MLLRTCLAAALLFAAPAGADPMLEFDAASDPILSNPHDLAFGPDGRLYVSDLGNDRIAVLSPVTLALENEIGTGALSAPHDVAFDRDGRMLVADTGNDRIAIYEGGREVGELSDGLAGPEGVLALADGRIVATGANNDALVIYDAEGALMARYAGPLSRPHDIIQASDGRFWVADSGNDRVLILDQELMLVATLEQEAFEWHGPRYMDFDGEGNAVVADKNSHRIRWVTPDLQLGGVLGAGAGRGPGFFRTPEGVAVRGDAFFFSDSGNNRVVRYRAIPD